MKDQPAKVTFHKRATVALDALPLEEKNTVLKAINYLSFFGIESALGENVKKFNIDEPLYFNLIREAETLLDTNPRSALIMIAVSIEVGTKQF